MWLGGGGRHPDNHQAGDNSDDITVVDSEPTLVEVGENHEGEEFHQEEVQKRVFTL